MTAWCMREGSATTVEARAPRAAAAKKEAETMVKECGLKECGGSARERK